MKKSIIVILVLISFIGLTAFKVSPKNELVKKEVANKVLSDEYCSGWDSGYKQGWCYGRGVGCIEPIVPICPIPRINESTFQDGYNRGFIQGKFDHDNQ